MSKTPHLTAPVPSKGMPKGIPYIIMNEAAERFSFYGMKAILTVFMTKYMLDGSGASDLMAPDEAKGWYHLFTTAVYFTPIFGALIADALFGKYKTILNLSIVYCLGHLALALDETRMGLAIGLTLIAIGSGGIKPCVSAHVGDQFGKSNAHLLEKVFLWFYFAINFGSFVSTLLTPFLLDAYGPHLAFGLPGLLMLFATIFFWMGRKVFIHIPPGGKAFVKETFSRDGASTIGRLAILYVLVAMFWALFDQTGSSWVLQAEKMDRTLFGIELLSSQVQAMNPILVMFFIPLCSFAIYPALSKIFPLTPLRKIALGFFMTVPAFLLPAWIESSILEGGFPSIGWQLAAYVILTMAEVFVSITILEFSYTQAPKKMKSLVMASYMLSISLGNLFTSGVNFFIQEEPPSFAPDVAGIYEVQLEASDGTLSARQSIRVEILEEAVEVPGQRPPLHAPPTASAGRFVAIEPGQPVRLYASADDGDARGDRSYEWSFVDVPSGSQVDHDALEGAQSRNPSFAPDVAGEYLLRFTFRVGEESASDTVRVLATSDEVAPIVSIAEAGAGVVHRDFELDGLGSYDPDGDALSYHWRLLQAPSGSTLGPDAIARSWLPGRTSRLEGAAYFIFFAMMMLLFALLFIPVAYFYKERSYIQDEVAEGEEGGGGDPGDPGDPGGAGDDPAEAAAAAS
ncbi:MAG: MFS transporter [Myxococcales bacterium]|nr:MFS transporter [Myxococcales bacterium]